MTALSNADGKLSAVITKGKGGDGIHIHNGFDSGGNFIFAKTVTFHVPKHVEAQGEIRSSSKDSFRQ